MRNKFRYLSVALTAALLLLMSPYFAVANQDPGISLPDDKSGYQIQLVYVETSSSGGSDYDKNGKIALWVEQLQSWLRIQTGKEFIFDTYQGKLDIAYIKFNGNITYQNDDKKLIEMYRKLNPTTYFGKTLVFVVDQKRPVNFMACGWAQPFSDYAYFFPNLTFSDGGKCKDFQEIEGINKGFTFEAQALLHEIIHSYGVEDHVCVDSTDLMQGSPECEERGNFTDTTLPVTFDATGSHYYGGAQAGVDLKTLKIWSDGSGQKRPELEQGICWVGERCKVSEITFPVQGTVQLQIKQGNKWIVVDSVKGVIANCKGCLKYLFVNSYFFQKSGNFQYRIFSPADKKYGAYVGPPKRIRVLG